MVTGHQISQARAVGRVDDDEIFTVNAALGRREFPARGSWAEIPDVPGPEDSPPREIRDRMEGTLVSRRGKFGAFVGCSRYPDCDYIRKEGPPPPDALPFDVECPKNGDGRIVARRARRTGNVFWGCSNYPRCDYTTNFEPVGAIHDADNGPVGRKADAGICLKCGASIELPDGDLVGRSLSGGPPNPAALARPYRGEKFEALGILRFQDEPADG